MVVGWGGGMVWWWGGRLGMVVWWSGGGGGGVAGWRGGGCGVVGVGWWGGGVVVEWCGGCWGQGDGIVPLLSVLSIVGLFLLSVCFLMCVTSQAGNERAPPGIRFPIYGPLFTLITRRPV